MIQFLVYSIQGLVDCFHQAVGIPVGSDCAPLVFTYRVSSDLENLEMSGNFDARRKSQGKIGEFLRSKESQEKSGNFVV